MFGGRKTSRRKASYRKGSKTCRRVKSSRVKSSRRSRIRRGGFAQWTPNGTRYGNPRYDLGLAGGRRIRRGGQSQAQLYAALTDMVSTDVIGTR